jgi:alpha-glucosidase/alpha-D-xyloside xylohydrolase
MNNPEIEKVTKKYDELRYQLLPYTYTLSWETRATGMPLMRALWLHYPKDTIAAAIGNQYLWGKDMMIAPVFEKGATARNLYLPAGTWYDWWTNESVKGGKFISRPVDLSIMPIYVRAGGIIPVDPVRQYTGEVITEPTTIRIYTGADGQFTLYEDDGISLEYLKNIGNWTGFTWNEKKHSLTIEPAAPAGSINIPMKRDFIIELLPGNKTRKVTYDGKKVTAVF